MPPKKKPAEGTRGRKEAPKRQARRGILGLPEYDEELDDDYRPSRTTRRDTEQQATKRPRSTREKSPEESEDVVEVIDVPLARRRR